MVVDRYLSDCLLLTYVSCLEDVGAAPDAAVDVDFDFVLQSALAQVVHHLTEVEVSPLLILM